MKSSPIAAVTAGSIALALSLATPPTFGEEQAQPPQIPGVQSGQDRPLGHDPTSDLTEPTTGSDRSLGQAKPAKPVPIAGARADDIVGTRIADSKGEEIGKVQAIVRGKATGTLQALVSVGGVLGMGAKEVTIPLSAVELSGSRLVSVLADSEDQLKAQPAYDASLYDRVPGEQRVDIGVADAGMAGTRAGQAAAAPFGALDADRDGYLSMEEAKAQPALATQWDSADINRDNRLDQAEFAAFEIADPGRGRGRRKGPMRSLNRGGRRHRTICRKKVATAQLIEAKAPLWARAGTGQGESLGRRRGFLGGA